MTDHPTPATPEATEREAREKLRYGIVNPHQLHGQGCGVYARTERECSCYMRVTGEKNLDAYRAAVAAVEYERGRRAERELWAQRLGDEEAAHKLTAETMAKAIRDGDKAEQYRVERDQARQALRAERNPEE